MGLKDTAALVGMSRHTVNDAWQRYLQRGWRAVDVHRTGRPAGSGQLLTEEQQKQTRRLISDKMPDQLKLPYALWSRQAVVALIAERYQVQLAPRTMSLYMKRWGFTSQKPMHRAFEQRPAEVIKWKQEVYPAIAARAKAEGAEIHWGDETGVRSDDVRGRCFAPRARTPIVRVNLARHGRSVIASISNKGLMRWMVFKGALDARLFKKFMGRLIRTTKRKVFLIVDNLRVHHAKVLIPWLEKHKHRIELFHLPSYSPELNPVEVANADLKQAIGKLAPARQELQMVRAIDTHLRSVQRRPAHVIQYFLHPDVDYAA